MTKFDAVAGDEGEASGFRKRDLLRFFLVDVIIIQCLRLLRLHGLLPSPDHYVILTLAGKGLLAAYLVWLVGSRPGGWLAAGAGSAGRPWAWPLAFVLFAAAIPVVFAASDANATFMAGLYGMLGLEYVPAAQNVAMALFGGELADWVWSILFFFTLAAGPLMEELAFRGVGMDAFGKGGGALAAALWTGFLFGLYHFDAARVLPLAIIGVMLAAGRILAKSLWCSAALHIAYNAFVLFWMWRQASESA